jgi:hypothetical protein
LDFSDATDQELRDGLDGMKKHLCELVNAPLMQRDGSEIAEMDWMIAAIESELEARRASIE